MDRRLPEGKGRSTTTRRYQAYRPGAAAELQAPNRFKSYECAKARTALLSD